MQLCKSIQCDRTSPCNYSEEKSLKLALKKVKPPKVSCFFQSMLPYRKGRKTGGYIGTFLRCGLRCARQYLWGCT